MDAAMLPVGHNTTVNDHRLDLAATQILSAHATGTLDDTQAAHALWGWASQAVQIDQSVRTAIRRRTPHHVSTSSVTDAVRSHVHEVLRRKLVDQWGQAGGFDPTHTGSFAGWVRGLTLAALHWHCSRIVADQARQVPVDSQESHPLDLLAAQQSPATVAATPIDDPLDIITAAETGMADLHADIWADVTVMAQAEVAPEHHPMLSRQVYSASYRVPPPARPLDPTTRREIQAALDTHLGQGICLTALRHKALRGCDDSPAAYGWGPLNLEHLVHPLAPLFQALWSPLDPLSAARVGDSQDLACWYAEAATYALPHRGKRPYDRFVSKVKALGREQGREQKELLAAMAVCWAAVEVEAYSPKWRNGTEEARVAQVASSKRAAARFDETLQATLEAEAHPLGTKRQAVLRHLRRIAVEAEFVDANPLVAHLDLTRLVKRIIDECPLAG